MVDLPVIIFTFLSLISLLLAPSSHALPAPPRTPAPGPTLSLQVQDTRDLEEAISDVLTTLHANPFIRYSSAKLVTVVFSVDPFYGAPSLPIHPAARPSDRIHIGSLLDPTHISPQNNSSPQPLTRTPSANPADFRSIILIFLYGGPPLPGHTGFWIFNRPGNRPGPAALETWQPPEPMPVGTERVPFDWGRTVSRMTLSVADGLLKSSGRRRRYGFVTLRSMDLAGVPRLAWCFHGVEEEGGGVSDVAVLTGSGEVVGGAVGC